MRCLPYPRLVASMPFVLGFTRLVAYGTSDACSWFHFVVHMDNAMYHTHLSMVRPPFEELDRRYRTPSAQKTHSFLVVRDVEASGAELRTNRDQTWVLRQLRSMWFFLYGGSFTIRRSTGYPRHTKNQLIAQLHKDPITGSSAV